VAGVFQLLEAEYGIAKEKLARVHSPIGLSIGAETPAEIAVSIMAEIIQVRRARMA
jgi:xanthine dehydrogenase accessory factor